MASNQKGLEKIKETLLSLLYQFQILMAEKHKSELVRSSAQGQQ